MNTSRKFTLIFLIWLLTVMMALAKTPVAYASELASQPSGENLAAQNYNRAGGAAESTAPADENGQITLLITIVIGLLLVASLVGIVTNRLRLPYTVGLVLIGLTLSFQGQANIEIPPEIFLGLLVPPLIFEAAFHIRAKDLVNDIVPILALAIPGVLITTFLVGGVVTLGTGFPIATALVFGALIAATDPVAVVALFRTLGVPKRLQVLLEGESLFNDGTAIVIFNLMIAIAVSGTFDPIASLIDFLRVAGGGLSIGFILGVLISQAIRFIDDDLIETTLTTVLAFGSYIVAEQFHVSGVLAVVMAGIVSGNIGPKGMSPSTRILVFNFWEYAAFLANSVVFLLIGFQIDIAILIQNWQVISWAILAVLVARAVSVYGLSWIGPGAPLRYKHVLYWGGLRGAISLALALSLPLTLGQEREEIKAMAFGVVLFTLLVQGLTMKPLINKMGLIHHNEMQEEYERRHARSVIAKTSYERLEEMHQQGLLPAHIWTMMAGPIQQHAQALVQSAAVALRADPDLQGDVITSAIREMLLSQRSALNNLLRDGIISEKTFSQLTAEVDTALAEPRSGAIELILRRQGNRQIEELMAIIVQETDEENVLSVLNRMGIQVIRLSSFGGFLAQRNSTLLVGLPQNAAKEVTLAIQKASHQRVAFLPSDTTSDTSVTVGGATIFSFDIERYEEL